VAPTAKASATPTTFHHAKSSYVESHSRPADNVPVSSKLLLL
jgi:hypothetical protein